MARPRSQKVTELKEKLIRRIEQGYYLPGSRFLSNRALGRRFGISYQTADTLLRELVVERYLYRKPGSGTYLRGEAPRWDGVELIFNERARRQGSFGALLRERLEEGFVKAGIRVRLRWADRSLPIGEENLPIFWECACFHESIQPVGRYCLLVNQTPPRGLSAAYCDAVSVDDHSGGMAAGELVRARTQGESVFILGGPRTDPRCQERVRGFCEALPGTDVYFADSWYYEDGLKAAGPLLRKNPGFVFCVNDRLAQALVDFAGEMGVTRPRLIGFDDAPIAEQLDLTTIAIPWMELATNVVEVAQKRIAGDTSTAITRILAPRPVMRASLG